MQKDLDFLCFCIIFVLEIRVIVACLVKWWVYSEEVRYIRFHISCIRVEECVVWRIGWYKYRLLVRQFAGSISRACARWREINAVWRVGG